MAFAFPHPVLIATYRPRSKYPFPSATPILKFYQYPDSLLFWLHIMKFFLWLLGRWGRTRPRTNALESSVVSKLPPELIIRIVEFLPLASIVSFCLSCRPIYFILGTEYLETLQKRDMDQER